ncbi:ammonia-dependent NAD(+) synthetase [Thermodesulfobacteriota bacterium]
MFIRPIEEVIDRLVIRSRELGEGCSRVFVAASGGVDSTVVTTILCLSFGPEYVVALFRNIKCDPQHLEDVKALKKILGFRLIKLDLTEEYDNILRKIKDQFIEEGLDWIEEGTNAAEKNGWKESYASLKSRFTTPLAGFISKAIDNGKGRIFGTGNAEEDGLLRYFDKFGDGAVDNNILDGLTKMEIRQLALYFYERFDDGEIFKRIAEKIPSADLWGCGDMHNDEEELANWARNMGYNKARITYGNLEKEGTIAWVLGQDEKFGVVSGEKSNWNKTELIDEYGYNEEEVQNILFTRHLEMSTRHKTEPPLGLSRKILKGEGYVK